MAKSNAHMLTRMWGNWTCPPLLAEGGMRGPPWKAAWRLLPKLSIYGPAVPHLGVHSKERTACTGKDLCSNVLTNGFEKQHKCPPAGEPINKVDRTSMKRVSGTKRDKLLTLTRRTAAPPTHMMKKPAAPKEAPVRPHF